MRYRAGFPIFFFVKRQVNKAAHDMDIIPCLAHDMDIIPCLLITKVFLLFFHLSMHEKAFIFFIKKKKLCN